MPCRGKAKKSMGWQQVSISFGCTMIYVNNRTASARAHLRRDVLALSAPAAPETIPRLRQDRSQTTQASLARLFFSRDGSCLSGGIYIRELAYPHVGAVHFRYEKG